MIQFRFKDYHWICLAMFYKSLFLLLYLSGLSVPAYCYLQKDIDNFNETQQCFKCDLTRSVIKLKITNKPNPIQIKESYLSNAKIQATDFDGSEIIDSNCMRILIANSSFNTSTFNGLNIIYSLIDNVKFINSEFNNVNWNFSQFINTTFNQDVFINSSFSNSDLKYSQFINSSLENIDFSQSDLRGVVFYGSKFKNINFKNADLRKANFNNTNVEIAELDSSLSYLCATLPDGTVYDNNGKECC